MRRTFFNADSTFESFLFAFSFAAGFRCSRLGLGVGVGDGGGVASGVGLGEGTVTAFSVAGAVLRDRIVKNPTLPNTSSTRITPNRARGFCLARSIV